MSFGQLVACALEVCPKTNAKAMRIVLTFSLAFSSIPVHPQQAPQLDPEVVDSNGCAHGKDGQWVCTTNQRIWIPGDLPYDHQSCVAFFEVIWGEQHAKPIGLYDLWPDGWSRWDRSEKRKKKYTGFCYERNASRNHYLVSWSYETGAYAGYIQVLVARSADVAPALAANRDPTIYRNDAHWGQSKGLEDAFKFIASQPTSIQQRTGSP